MKYQDTAVTWPAVAESGGAWARLRALLLRVNAPLLAILALGVAFTAYYTTQMSDWLVMTDELLYVKLAQSITHTLSPVPTVHGEYFAVFNQLYPLLTSPVYAIFDMPTAFKVVHVFNALIMGSAAIPAYLLTREVVRSRLAAYLVAALTVSVPWMVMSTMVLTEVVAYPAFIWAILAIQRTVATPSASRDLVAILAILVAFLGRTQLLLLAIVLPLALVIHEVGLAISEEGRGSARKALGTGLRNVVRAHRTLIVVAGAALLAAAAMIAAGSLGKLLGNYEPTAKSGGLLPHGIAHSAAVHLDFVIVAVGVLPFVLAAGWAVSTLIRPSSKAGHAFAAILLVVVPALTLEVASFDLRFVAGAIQDRYLFYIAPLLFVGMVACLLEARKPSLSVVAAGVAFAFLATEADYAPWGGPYFGSPASAFHVVLHGKAYQLGHLFSIDSLQTKTAIAVAGVVLAAGAVALIRYTPRRAALLCVGLPVLAFCVAETRYVFDRMLLPSEGRAVSGRSVDGKNWIDETTPAASVGLVPSPINYLTDSSGRPFFTPLFEKIWWSTEFWNKGADRSYSYRRSTTYTPFPASRLSIDPRTGAARFTDPSDYLVLAEGEIRFGLAGRTVKRVSAGLPSPALDLVEPARPYRARWLTWGLDIDGWTHAGEPAHVRVFGPAHGHAGVRLSIVVASTADVLERRRYEIRGPEEGVMSSGNVAPATLARSAVPVCVGRQGFSDVTIHVHGSTAFLGRKFGLRVIRIEAAADPAACGA
jgi:hypothetical protein